MKQNVSFVSNVGFLLLVMMYILDQTVVVDLKMIRFGLARSICLQQQIFSDPGSKLQGQRQGPLKEIHPGAKFHDRCSWIQWDEGDECVGNGTGCSKFTKKSCKELGLADTQPEDSYNSRIIDGTEVEKDAYPSFVRIVFMNKDEFFCSGVIIDPSWVLTANRCLIQPEMDFTVISGRSKLNESEEGEQVRKSDRQVSYDYSEFGSEGSLAKDLALLHLETPLELDGKKAAAVKLPTEPIESGDVIIVGAGQTTGDENEDPQEIHEITLPILADEPCKARMGEPFFDEFLCMAGKGDDKNKSTCAGDEGAPIYSIGEDNSQVLVATSVFAFGARCGLIPNLISVGLETIKFVDWIKNVTAS